MFIILFGDFGQLPPVMDVPLYSAEARSALSDLGRIAYQCLGITSQQVRFRDILMSFRDT